MNSITELELHEIPVPLVVPSRWQPRELFDEEALLELAKSIRDYGLMYPIIVFVNEDGEYELVAGERRTRATVALGLTKCKSWTSEYSNGLRKAIKYVAAHGWSGLGGEELGGEELLVELMGIEIMTRIEDGGDHRRLHELAVADNIQRENLTPLEEARALQDLMSEYDLSQRAVAKQVGWSQSKVQQSLSLLRLAPEARQALTTRVVSPSHARHLAKLPAWIQPGVTAYVEKMIKKEGDQAATVAKVASLVRQVGAFIKPVYWLLPADTVVLPRERNTSRLLYEVMKGADASGRVGKILDLRLSGYDVNLMGKRPGGLSDNYLCLILSAFTGENRGMRGWWADYAERCGWTCEQCAFRELASPEGSNFGDICARWVRGAVTTCRRFIGVNDPFIIPVERRVLEHMKETVRDALGHDSFWYATEHAAWKRAVEEVAAIEAEQQRVAKEKRDNEHIVGLAGYWAEQQHGGLFFDADCFQAHRCVRCTHYHAELLVEDLPPCDFVLKPLVEKWSSSPVAPGFGVLVGKDGQMLPRCEHFHRADVEISPTVGFVLPKHSMVLEWMRRMLVGISQYTHNSTMCRPLAWMPYGRGKHGLVHNTNKLLGYVGRTWKEWGDERVATVITALSVECRACNSQSTTFELFDPTTLEVTVWASTGWGEAVRGESGYHYYTSWPEGWPMPWKKEK